MGQDINRLTLRKKIAKTSADKVGQIFIHFRLVPVSLHVLQEKDASEAVFGA